VEIVANAGGGLAEDQPAALTEIITRWLATEEPRHPPFPLLTGEGASINDADEPAMDRDVPATGETPATSFEQSPGGAADDAEPSSDVRVLLEPEDDEPPAGPSRKARPTVGPAEGGIDAPGSDVVYDG
jgi:hypothetical protein